MASIAIFGHFSWFWAIFESGVSNAPQNIDKNIQIIFSCMPLQYQKEKVHWICQNNQKNRPKWLVEPLFGHFWPFSAISACFCYVSSPMPWGAMMTWRKIIKKLLWEAKKWLKMAKKWPYEPFLAVFWLFWQFQCTFSFWHCSGIHENMIWMFLSIFWGAFDTPDPKIAQNHEKWLYYVGYPKDDFLQIS